MGLSYECGVRLLVWGYVMSVGLGYEYGVKLLVWVYVYECEVRL